MKRSNEENLWIDKFIPKNIDDLFIHKKKLEEIEECFNEIYSNNNQKPTVLIFTGPSGCGKTLIVKLIAKKLNINICEWINPLSSASSNSDLNFTNYSHGITNNFDSQSIKFSDFIKRTSRYPTLQIIGGRAFRHKLVLIKDFPNIHLSGNSSFSTLINDIINKDFVHPILFITDENQQFSFIKKLLNQDDYHDKMDLKIVKFNPVNRTSMLKILKKVIEDVSKMYQKVYLSDEEIEEIIIKSNGDARVAINSLQFEYSKKSTNINGTKKDLSENINNYFFKRSKQLIVRNPSCDKILKEINSKNIVGYKDNEYSLFRLFGKILHCKRLPQLEYFDPILPENLKDKVRYQLTFNIEELIEKSDLSSDLYNSFLHQNYPEFINSFENIISTINYICLSDIFTKEWSSKFSLNSYSYSLATRGVVYSSDSESSDKIQNKGLVPIRKPQRLNIESYILQSNENIKSVFNNSLINNNVLCTEMIPFFTILNSHLTNSQKRLTQELGSFKNIKL